MRNKAFAAILLVAMAGAAFGQTYRSTGKGDFTRGRDKQRIEEARISFTRSSFTLTLGLERGRKMTFSGDASGSGSRRNLRIRNIEGLRDADGSGRVTLDGDVLKSIDISGNPNSGRYEIKYSGREESDNRPSPAGSSAGGNTTGVGRYRWGREDSQVKKLVFSLHENGSLTITVKGDPMRDVSFFGRWTGQGDTRSFTVDKSARGQDVSGSGTLKLSDDRREIRSLDLSGRMGNDRFTITFRDK